MLIIKASASRHALSVANYLSFLVILLVAVDLSKCLLELIQLECTLCCLDARKKVSS